jgi:hypothetical protein
MSSLKLTKETLDVHEGKSKSKKSKKGTIGSPAKSTGSGDTSASAMLDLKNNRKRAEADLQLLSNRLALLRAEESRALTKITETKTRAKEILDLKKRNENHIKEKTNHNMLKEEKNRENRIKVNQLREERQAKLAQSKKLVTDSRKKMAEDIKENSRKNEEKKEAARRAATEEKRLRAEVEQRRQDAARREKERARAEAEKAAQLEYAKKMAEEAKKTKEAEDLIQMLEREERELIDRLKKTQNLQEKAYGALQSSLEL